MANLNQKARGTSRTINKAGGTAYNYNDSRLELYQMVTANMFNENSFYASADELRTDLDNALDKVLATDPEFVLELAVYTRNFMNLRSVSTYMLAYFARNAQTAGSLTKKYGYHVISRADELANALAYSRALWDMLNTTKQKQEPKFPAALRKTVQETFGKFDEYQLSKYRLLNKQFKLADAIKVAHPGTLYPNMNETYHAIIEGRLKMSDKTWEKKVSTNVKGSAQANWTDVAADSATGYMAHLRNLRNYIDNDVPEDILRTVADKLSDENAVRNSKQLPFRFLAAYRALKPAETSRWGYGIRNRNANAPKFLLEAVEAALEASIDNYQIDGDVGVLIDLSGSMWDTPPSEKSSILNVEIGALLGVIAARQSNRSVIVGFGHNAVELPINATKVLNAVSQVLKANDKYGIGHATNGHYAVDLLTKKNYKLDKIICVTDMQLWDTSHSGRGLNGSVNNYRRDVNNGVQFYAWNVAASNTGITPDSGNNYVVSGYSEKNLRYISGALNIVQEIKDWTKAYVLKEEKRFKRNQ